MAREYTDAARAALMGTTRTEPTKSEAGVYPVAGPESGLKEGAARVPAQDIADAIVRYINARELAHFQRSQPHLNKAYEDLVRTIDAALGISPVM